MPRKLLFVVFSLDSCRRNHALLHALELADAGFAVRLIFEGEAVRSLNERDGLFPELLAAAQARGLVAGVCQTAAAGCDDPTCDVRARAQALDLPLLGTMRGHAGIADSVADGYEIVVY